MILPSAARRAFDKTDFLASTDIIDWHQPAVKTLAGELASDMRDPVGIAKNCYIFVRDEIKHSGDTPSDHVTCRASDVLRFATGYCYAKSHLLAALLRANGIAAGLCYQRLTITDKSPFCLHGLNAIYLPEFGWYKVDARGNKPGVDAAFCPPVEKLAFPIVTEGEIDFSEIYSTPRPEVVSALTRYTNCAELGANLPDTPASRA